jgi:hypothetical protein
VTLRVSRVSLLIFVAACTHTPPAHAPTTTIASTASDATSPAPVAATDDRPESLRIDPALGVIPVIYTGDRRLGPPFDLTLLTSQAAQLLPAARTLHADAQLGPDGQIHVTVGPTIAPSGTPSAQHTTPSWVVDYDEPSVQALAHALKQKHGRTPTLDELVVDVSSHLASPQHGAFDIASRAVTLKRGDCSEHAVVLAGLARYFGHAARVMFGFVIATAAPDHAFGHAWTEIHDGTQWQRHDSALHGLDTVAYLPLSTLTDESAGYSFAAMQDAQLMLSVERLAIAPVTPPTAARGAREAHPPDPSP